MHLKRISTYISVTVTKKAVTVLSLLLLLGGGWANAQNRLKKVATVEKDTIPWFNGMAVSVDLIGPAQLMVSDYGQYEASLRVNLKDKYYPIFELGYGKADAFDESTQITYKTSAPYARLGVDWNLLKTSTMTTACLVDSVTVSPTINTTSLHHPSKIQSGEVMHLTEQKAYPLTITGWKV